MSIAAHFLGEQRLEPIGKYQYLPTGLPGDRAEESEKSETSWIGAGAVRLSIRSFHGIDRLAGG